MDGLLPGLDFDEAPAPPLMTDDSIGDPRLGPQEWLDRLEVPGWSGPWPHQREGFFRAVDAFCHRGIKSGLIVWPTGTGKTVGFGLLARYLVEQRGMRVLILAHRDRLLTQAQRKLERLGVATAREQAGQRARDEIRMQAMMTGSEPKVVVGSVPTMHRDRLESHWDPSYFDFIVVDEAHHAVGGQYREILGYFGHAQVLGKTATATRTDGASLGEVFGELVHEYRLDDAIRDGRLKTIVVRTADVKVDLRGIRTSGGDFNEAQLAERISANMGPLANAIRESIGERRGIVFTPGVKSA
jgi:superfamily II DNA or RNA helicase